MAQTIKGVLSGLTAACQSLYANQTGPDGLAVVVSYGPSGSYQPGALVMVGMDVRQPITRPTMGTGRSREKAVEVDVVISAYGAGDESVQQPVTEKAIDLAELLDAYFRTSPQETLSGACREAFLSNIAGPIPGAITDGEGVMGRVAELTATVTAYIRY